MKVRFLDSSLNEAVQNVQKVKTFLFTNPSDSTGQQIVKNLVTDSIEKMRRNTTSMMMSDGKLGVMANNKNFMLFSCLWYFDPANAFSSFTDGVQLVRRRKLTDWEFEHGQGDQKFPDSKYVWSIDRCDFYGIDVYHASADRKVKTSNLMRNIVKKFANLPEKGMTLRKLDDFIRNEVHSSGLVSEITKLKVIRRGSWFS